MTKLLDKSRFLSYVLRHKPEAIQLKLDKEGWANIQFIIDASQDTKTQLTRAEVEQIVSEDDKGRYAISPGGEKIRANQGHSTSSVDIKFKKAIPPIKLYHGTTKEVAELVLKQGLKAMKRHYVHLSIDIATAINVAGRRKNETQLLQIDCKAMVAEGFKFSISDNNVWLIEEVPAKYISKVNHE